MHVAHRLGSWLGHHLIWILLAFYGVAAVAPGPGLMLRGISLGSIGLGGESLPLTLPTLLLGLLLLHASMGVDTHQLRSIAARPGLLLVSLAANMLIPFCFIGLSALLLLLWPDPGEVQSLLVGLAILGAMPIAGSSTAWAQQAQGNLALSLGLVFSSTLLSPVITPMCFVAISWVTHGKYAAQLLDLAGAETQLFLLVAVVLPCCLGLLLRAVLPRRLVQTALPWLKLLSKIYLILLNYANAAMALPQFAGTPDWGYLAAAAALATTLCALRFGGGYVAARRSHAPPAETTSMMFGLGMNNNGSGLVLAANQMPHDLNLLLLIVAYNIAQQIGAGIAHHLVTRDIAVLD